ncbi:MAG: phosphohistidine phosphatase SixA, partial [Synechococcales bacterium]|nr:phosphohistidine phosphatase SixA [Synechococcales bacterium]
MFHIYFVRHGLAGQLGDYPDDALRPLTEEGSKKTHKIAQRLKELDLHADLILTSPYQRAQQTAEILRKAGISPQMETADFLAPGGDLQAWLAWVMQWRSVQLTPKAATKSAAIDPTPRFSLVLVGHEPEQSEWAEQLLWGQARGSLIQKKAGIIGLEAPLTGELL